MARSDERRTLVRLTADLTSARLQEFFEVMELERQPSKRSYLAKIEEIAGTKRLPLAAIADLFDRLAPSSRQHVFLLKSPQGLAREFRESLSERVESIMKRHGLTGSRRTVLTPPSPTLASIVTSGTASIQFNVVSTIETHEYDSELNFERTDENGDQIEFRAYRKEISRCVSILRWNLVSGEAQLQVTQLSSEGDYDRAWTGVSGILAPDLHIELFENIDLPAAIRRLHESAERPTPEVRVQMADYNSPLGRRLSGRGSTTKHSLSGEALVDKAMKTIRDSGVGRLATFYWQPQPPTLTEEVRVQVVAEQNRLNFSTNNDEAAIAHILARVRAQSL